MMYPHKTIFSARGVTRAGGRYSDTIRIPTGDQRPLRGEAHRGQGVTNVLTGPKCPLTRPTSSSKILCQNLVSNLP